MEIKENNPLSNLEEKAFYNQPSAKADFNYLFNLNVFTIDQLTAVSFGKNPEQVNLESISRMPSIYDFPKEYKKRYMLILNFFSGGLITLYEFMEWTSDKGFELPRQLMEWFDIKKEENKKIAISLNKKFPPRAEVTYQNMVAALLDFIKGKIPGVEPHPSYASDNKLIEVIAKYYDGIAGLTQSTLSHKIPECRRSLEASS